MSVAPLPPTSDTQATILDWLAALYDQFDTGWLTLFSIDRTTGDRHIDWSPIDNYDLFTDTAIERAQTGCVWFGVATRGRRLPAGRGRADDCAQIPGLWLDIDIHGPGHQTAHPLPPDTDTARALIAGFPLEPTAVIHSGGGLQAWWLFPEPLDTTDAAPLLARWGATWAKIGADTGWHIDNVFDIARVMRLPGTTNHKTDEPQPVLVIEHTSDRHDPTSIDELLIDPPAAPERTPVASIPYIGPERPGDAFNAVRTGTEVLQAAGWEHHHTDHTTGDEHWTRPGKDRRNGSSATVYADDGHTTIWTDAIPGLATRRPYDPFGLYTALFHAGDFSAASDHLETQGYGTKPRPDDLSWLPATPAAEPPVEHHIDPELDDFLNTADPDYDWLVEGLVERHDRIIVTGEEGHGKSTLLRQIAVQLASGIHPFTGDPIEPLQVLYVDCENSERQVRRKVRDLRTAAGDNYINGKLRLRVLGHALDLADTAIEADLAARINVQQVDVLIIGPLYKLLFDDPVKELPAKAVADVIDRLRLIRGSAVFMEAHSPYAEGSGKKRPTRPYGASLWSRWPEFGIHIGADGALTHWRGQRDERSWPARLERSEPWPWAAAEPATESHGEWHGPTECASAIVTLLTELDVELSTRKIGDELRARGQSYRDDTIRTAARLAHNQGRLGHRIGPRNSDLYKVEEHAKVLDDFF